MKKCPFCAEEIQDQAIKCRYCMSSLLPVQPTHAPQPFESLFPDGAPPMPTRELPVPKTPPKTRKELPDLSRYSPYYQDEFESIYDSNESYKGRWNWAAFFFGILWAMTKGLWASVIVVLAIGFATAGFGFFLSWFYYGARGNFLYYNSIVKRIPDGGL